MQQRQEHIPAEVEQRTGGPIFDISGIDLRSTVMDRAGIESWIPHRGAMSLLDSLVWRSDDWQRSLGRKNIRSDEFWVPGHFPGFPVFPGVMMIETAAQLSALAFLAGRGQPGNVLFLRIDEASFRSTVKPGDCLLILCQGIKLQRRRFVTRVQGVVMDGEQQPRVTCEAILSGMVV